MYLYGYDSYLLGFHFKNQYVFTPVQQRPLLQNVCVTKTSDATIHQSQSTLAKWNHRKANKNERAGLNSTPAKCEF